MNDKIKEILSKYKTIAMVGVSKDDKKPSTIVMKYMQKYGFKVFLGFLFYNVFWGHFWYLGCFYGKN